MLALERGEIEGYPALFWSTFKATKPEWLTKNIIHAITYQGSTPPPEKEMAGAVAATSLAKTDEARQIMVL